MFTYEDSRVDAIQARFLQLRNIVDAATQPVRQFKPNHRSEIYKAILKTVVLEDSELVEMTVSLAQDRYPAADVLVYPMLHLAGDTNERGHWHRDGAEKNRRVFWIPLTPYHYRGLSIISWSAGLLSKPLAFIGWKLFNLDNFATKPLIGPRTFFGWSPRMIHRGNINTSDDLSSAIVIFLDQAGNQSSRRLTKLDSDVVRQWIATMEEAVVLDDNGNILRVDQQKLRSLPSAVQTNFVDYFKLRTKIDLHAL